MRTARGMTDPAVPLLTKLRTALTVLAPTLVVHLFAPAALAEQTTQPPEPDKPWLQWMLVFAFLALCCGIAFKNPKRSHQG